MTTCFFIKWESVLVVSVVLVDDDDGVVVWCSIITGQSLSLIDYFFCCSLWVIFLLKSGCENFWPIKTYKRWTQLFNDVHHVITQHMCDLPCDAAAEPLSRSYFSKIGFSFSQNMVLLSLIPDNNTDRTVLFTVKKNSSAPNRGPEFDSELRQCIFCIRVKNSRICVHQPELVIFDQYSTFFYLISDRVMLNLWSAIVDVNGCVTDLECCFPTLQNECFPCRLCDLWIKAYRGFRWIINFRDVPTLSNTIWSEIVTVSCLLQRLWSCECLPETSTRESRSSSLK